MKDIKNVEDLYAILKDAQAAILSFRTENGDLLKDGSLCDDGRDFGIDSLLDTLANRLCDEVKEWNRFVEDWKANGKEMEGWLLEIQNEKGEWFADELDLECSFSDWEGIEINFNTVSGAPTKFNEPSLSDTWEDRRGVDWDKWGTPKNDPHESGIWGGVCSSNGLDVGQLWRVKKIKFLSFPSKNLLKAIEENPDFRVRF